MIGRATTAVPSDYPTGNIGEFLAEFNTPKQNLGANENEGLDELETLDTTEPASLQASGAVARESAKVIVAVIDTALPAALGFMAKEDSSTYRADEESRNDLQRAVAAYLRLHGSGDIPPGMLVLLLVISIYGTQIPAALQHRQLNTERETLEARRREIERREAACAAREADNDTANHDQTD